MRYGARSEPGSRIPAWLPALARATCSEKSGSPCRFRAPANDVLSSRLAPLLKDSRMLDLLGNLAVLLIVLLVSGAALIASLAVAAAELLRYGDRACSDGG